MANPTLTPFPTPPLPEQDEATFNRNAANSLTAQANFVGEGNIVIIWMGQQVDSVATNAASALSSSKNAATSAKGASGSADAAANSASQAQTYAAAAGAAAGAPSISGKGDYTYSVNAAGNGTEWRVAPLRPTAERAGQIVVYNSAGTGFDAAAIAVPTVTKYFESGSLGIVASTVASAVHGLGARPKFVAAHLYCIGATNGYAPGDTVEICPHAGYAYDYTPVVEIYSDANRVYAAFGSNLDYSLIPKSGGQPRIIPLRNFFTIILKAII